MSHPFFGYLAYFSIRIKDSPELEAAILENRPTPLALVLQQPAWVLQVAENTCPHTVAGIVCVRLVPSRKSVVDYRMRERVQEEVLHGHCSALRTLCEYQAIDTYPGVCKSTSDGAAIMGRLTMSSMEINPNVWFLNCRRDAPRVIKDTSDSCNHVTMMNSFRSTTFPKTVLSSEICKRRDASVLRPSYTSQHVLGYPLM